MLDRRGAVLALTAALVAVVSCCGAAGDGAGRRVRLPAALPADVPLPEPAVLRSAQDLGVRGLNLVFETDGPVSAVAGRLRVRLEAGGWVLLSEAALESAVFFSYRKGERSVALGVSRTGDVTVVGVAYQAPAREPEGEPG